MESIVSVRIKNSRIQKGLSLQEVADNIGVSKQMISKYETGKSIPNSAKLIALSKLFSQKVDYFFRKPEVELGEINFRKKSKFGNKKINSLKEDIRIQIENYLLIENICNLNIVFNNPIQNFQIQSKNDIVLAVKSLRESWKIGNDVIHNIIELLEYNEIKVIEVADDSSLFDGLATIIDEKYYVLVINKNMPIERKRFTLLHELGHLLLNITSSENKEIEKYCNLFASEMLLSEENAKMEFGEKRRSISKEELKNIQEKYGISVAAIVYKLGNINIISQEKTATFFKQMNSNPILKKELEESRFDGNEISFRYSNLVYRSVSEEAISMSKASSLLKINLAELRENLTINIR
jgi:Zn-dependent peptidase ImmA (M78 family)